MTSKRLSKQDLSAIRRLVRTLKHRQKEYEGFSSQHRALGHIFESNRYEGIATGSRWAREDLEVLLRE